MSSDNSADKNHWFEYSGKGLVLGAGIGLLIGAVMNSVGIGLSLGAGVGLVLGAGFGMTQAVAKDDERD